jgi:hypothetical protein
MIIINVQSQEQWDEVTKYYNLVWKSVNKIPNYNGQTAICPLNNTYGPIVAYDSKYEIFTYEKWLKSINKKEKSMVELMNDVLSKTYDNPILRRTTVPLFMSNPGIGKSTIIREFAEKKGVKMVKITLSTRMPNEVAGMVI